MYHDVVKKFFKAEPMNFIEPVATNVRDTARIKTYFDKVNSFQFLAKFNLCV